MIACRIAPSATELELRHLARQNYAPCKTSHASVGRFGWYSNAMTGTLRKLLQRVTEDCLIFERSTIDVLSCQGSGGKANEEQRTVVTLRDASSSGRSAWRRNHLRTGKRA